MNEILSKGFFLKKFLMIAGIILWLTGFAKVWSGLGSARVLEVGDPITGIMFWHLMVFVGTVEIAIALFCFFGNCLKLALLLVAWLSTSFILYRFGLWWIGWSRPCSCLGNLTDALPITQQTAETAMKFVLAYLLIGSYGSLFWLWRQRKKAAALAGI